MGSLPGSSIIRRKSLMLGSAAILFGFSARSIEERAVTLLSCAIYLHDGAGRIAKAQILKTMAPQIQPRSLGLLRYRTMAKVRGVYFFNARCAAASIFALVAGLMRPLLAISEARERV